MISVVETEVAAAMVGRIPCILLSRLDSEEFSNSIIEDRTLGMLWS